MQEFLEEIESQENRAPTNQSHLNNMLLTEMT